MECFILAGGRSRRFGEDKLLYRIGKDRTIDYVVRTAKGVCSEVCITTKDREKFKSVGARVIEDALPDQAPIIGIYTALRESSGSEVLILSADTPLIKQEVLKLLIKEFEEPVTILSVGGKLHPLIGVYSRSLLPLLEEYIRFGGRSVVGFLRNVRYKTLDEETLKKVDPELVSTFNLNTKEDLRKLLERIG